MNANNATLSRLLSAIPPIHRYAPLFVRQTFSKQSLERIPEPTPIEDQLEHVLQYDQVMTTKLAIAYAIAVEFIYRFRGCPYGGAAVDLACGPGHFALWTADCLRLDSLLGIDLSTPMIEIASRNAQLQGQTSSTFQVGDVTDLAVIDDSRFDLCTFTDATHHMPNLETVAKVVSEMDRITKPDGLVFVMDLARLRTAQLTKSYVELVGENYRDRGLNAFYDDFQNSMYAAWTANELATTVRQSAKRKWYQLVPRGLPVMQFLIGVPTGQSKLFLRGGLLNAIANCVAPEFRAEWQALRQSMRWSRIRRVAQ